MKDTLKTLIDNGLLAETGQIECDGSVCHSWRIENDIVFKNEQDTEGTEIFFLILDFPDESCSRFQLETEVIFDGFDLHVVEDYSRKECILNFQKITDIFPEDFLIKNNQNIYEKGNLQTR